MEGATGIDLNLILFGTIGMLILSLALVSVFFIHRKKTMQKEIELAMIQSRHQQDMLHSVIDAKEKEQLRIARDLHDDVGSSINAIKLHLDKYRLSEKDHTELNDNLKMVARKVREISNELYPAVLEELGLENALKNLCRKLTEASGIDFIYSGERDSRQDPEKQICLAFYRITQELLNNIIKHAGATEVQIGLLIGKNQTELSIADNGKGFKGISEAKSGEHHGLKSIDSRLQLIGAQMSYDPYLNSGSKVVITKTYEKNNSSSS